MDAFDNQGSSMTDKQLSMNDQNDGRLDEQSFEVIKR